MVLLDELSGLETLEDLYRPQRWEKPDPFILDRGDTDEDSVNIVTNANESIYGPDRLPFSDNGSAGTFISDPFISAADPEYISEELRYGIAWTTTLLNRIRNPKAIEIIASFSEVLSTWVEEHGNAADSYHRDAAMSFQEMPPSYAELIRAMYHQLAVEPEFSALEPGLAYKIGDYTASQLILAIPYASVAGTVMSQYQLDYRLRLGLDYINSYDFEQRTIRFKSFGTYWYPTWQFNFYIRGDVLEDVPGILEECRKRGFSDLEILAWASQAFEQLDGLTPAQWMQIERSQSTVRSILPSSPPLVLPESRLPLHRQADRFIQRDPVDGPVKILPIEECISESFEVIKMNKPALLQFGGFIRNFLDKGDGYYNQILDPVGFGQQAATQMINSYFQIEAFNQRYINYMFEKKDTYYKLDVNAANWLGTQAARFIAKITGWCSAIGEMYTEQDIIQIFGDDQADKTNESLKNLQERHQLISVELMDERVYPCWQINAEKREVRPIVRKLLPALESQDIHVPPFAIMAWANSPETEYLGGTKPSEYMISIEESEDDPTNQLTALWNAARVMVQRYFY